MPAPLENRPSAATGAFAAALAEAGWEGGDPLLVSVHSCPLCPAQIFCT